MSNEMVRFPSELIAAASEIAHADRKSTSTWIRDLVAGEVARRKLADSIDWKREGELWAASTQTWTSGLGPPEYKPT